MIVITFDLGTKTGWCCAHGTRYNGGMWDLSGGRHEGGGMRFLRFRHKVRELIALAEKTAPDEKICVGYEEVARHLGTAAAHVYGGLLAVLQEECEVQNIPYEGHPVGTIKKHATGKGNSAKDKMVAAAEKKWPHIEIADHNQADAMHIAHYVQSRMNGGI